MNPAPAIPIQAGQALAILQRHLGGTLVACYLQAPR